MRHLWLFAWAKEKVPEIQKSDINEIWKSIKSRIPSWKPIEIPWFEWTQNENEKKLKFPCKKKTLSTRSRPNSNRKMCCQHKKRQKIPSAHSVASWQFEMVVAAANLNRHMCLKFKNPIFNDEKTNARTATYTTERQILWCIHTQLCVGTIQAVNSRIVCTAISIGIQTSNASDLHTKSTIKYHTKLQTFFPFSVYFSYLFVCSKYRTIFIIFVVVSSMIEGSSINFNNISIEYLVLTKKKSIQSHSETNIAIFRLVPSHFVCDSNQFNEIVWFIGAPTLEKYQLIQKKVGPMLFHYNYTRNYEKFYRVNVMGTEIREGKLA